MADPPPPDQKHSIIAKGMIHQWKDSGKSGDATPKVESKPEVGDVIESLPDPIYGTTEHVEPGFWASFAMQSRASVIRERSQTLVLRLKKPIRELVLRRPVSGSEFRSMLTRPRVQRLLVQVVGTTAEKPCDRCRRGLGWFTTCVFVEGMRDNCCANCLGQGAECSLSAKPARAMNKTGIREKQIRKVLRRAAQGTREIRTSMKSLTLGFENILNAAQDGVSDIKETKFSSTMKGLSAQVDDMLGAMQEFVDVVMKSDDGRAMMPGDAISINDDEEGVDGSPSKVETPELCGVKTEFSGCTGDDDEPKIKKEKQDAGENDSESKSKYNTGVEIKEEKRSVK